jgi:hypothetical protein
MGETALCQPPQIAVISFDLAPKIEIATNYLRSKKAVKKIAAMQHCN